ncbi:hypothetical protein ACLXAZ_33195, partial [Escherichia coli]
MRSGLRHRRLRQGRRAGVRSWLGPRPGTLPLMKVSDYLTWLAEAILVEVLELAWRQLVQ